MIMQLTDTTVPAPTVPARVLQSDDASRGASEDETLAIVLDLPVESTLALPRRRPATVLPDELVGMYHLG
jgi:hypothetical protein